MGLEKEARSVLLPGVPGMATSESCTVQVTVAVTWAGCPTGTKKPLVSTLTPELAHRSPCVARVPS